MFLSIHGKINDAEENAHTHTHTHTAVELGGCGWVGAALEADAKMGESARGSACACACV